MGPRMTRPVLRFADIGREAAPVAGGKGASLGELLRAGIRVPDGFVVVTAAFRQAVEHLAVHGEPIAARVAGLDPDDREAVAAETAEIRAAVGCAPLPATVVEAITAHYERLCAEAGHPDMPVAVRSSATSEDSAEASFAGLQDTYLWVNGGGSVVEHVRRCWASLYSVESVTYRLHRGIPFGRKVEAHYGCPQDIEWAVSRTAPPGENVFLLQSRPETVWAEKNATRKAPAAAPAARAFDHVFNVLGKRTSEG